MRWPHRPIVRLARLLALALALPVQAAVDANLEDLPATTNLYDNGADLAGGFRSRGVHFGNLFNPTWQSWAGFAWSRVNDPLTPGWDNQYAVISGSGQGGSATYAIGYDDGAWGNSDVITLPVPCPVRGLYLNNTTYTALDLRDGSGFSKAFGGPSGNDPDWFLLTITGHDVEGRITGSNAVYLADFRFTNNASDYILTNWTWVALDSLGPAVKTLAFALTSSDVGAFGMNTPAFFALDGLRTDERYAPAAGQPGSTAVGMAATNVLRWATGWTNYHVGANCDTNWQTPHQALGPASGLAFDIVCLGEGGELTLTFDPPLVDGPGADFAIFENGFGDGFLELAYVEVSSDGAQFHRFFNRSLTTAPVPSFGTLAPTNVIGLGSKYRQGFGEPYDLADLEGAPGLDGQAVRYVRMRDVSGNGSMLDSAGHPIYDPYLATGSAGFDLDGMAALSNNFTEVSLHLLQAEGQEGGTQAVFRVRRRTWQLDQPLAVSLAWSGTAVAGHDYPTPPSPVIIPAGHAHVDVPLTALWDAEVESPETVTVQVIAGDYTLRAPTTVTLVLADATPADTWRAAGLDFGADTLPLSPPAAYWNGADGSGGFWIDGVFFANVYNATYGSWAGFSYSRVNDPATPGWNNQYAVSSGTGVGGSPAYVVAYDDGAFGNTDVITLPHPSRVRGLYVNNTTYAALDLREGSGFSKAFGGLSGDDPDWFLLTITGHDAGGTQTGSAAVYLADFRFTNNASDFILTNWTWVALETLGPDVKTLEFTLSSSDVGPFGMNTPAFFALDGLRLAPGGAGAADDADWNGDGIPNLLAYTLGRRLGETLDAPPLKPVLTNGAHSAVLTVEFQRRRPLHDASLHAVVSSTLANGEWLHGMPHVEEEVIAIAGDVETVRARLLTTNDTAFTRLRAQRP